MKNKLEKLVSGTLSETEEDSLLQEIIRKKQDRALRNRWEQELENKHGIKKVEDYGVRVISYKKYVSAFVTVAACFAIFFGIRFFNQESTAETLAINYLHDQEILHAGSYKGAAKEDTFRFEAMKAFNSNEYEESIINYNKLDHKTEEDTYYLSLAYLLGGQYNEAALNFEKLSVYSKDYEQEINWYLALSYLLNGQNDKAKLRLRKINDNEWNYNKALKLLNSLN
ncbi:tetratricopeptide repeat protein [Aquimarina celericrescens]|uniref:Tol-pal system YbgF family protein n=1 Tax=Aquimarina celericrescens TaxID=1964542 RepID=A0ABW5AWJ3_9FLAO|nr:hypothetical protein [Aquimarina celericrescens]